MELRQWKRDFEAREKREPNKADLGTLTLTLTLTLTPTLTNKADFTMAEPRIKGLARRMGEFD